MAKPCHTCYQVQADFTDMDPDKIKADFWTERGITDRIQDGYIGINPTCLARGTLRQQQSYSNKGVDRIRFSTLEEGQITFGLDKAEALVKSLREAAKKQFIKGARPAFFLRKMTMSEFLDHKNFKNYKDDPTVKRVFKKYHLMDLLRKEGFQTS